MADKLQGQDARQGKRGKPVLYVLIASMVLLAIAITGLMTWQGANSPKDYASQSQDASRKEITGSVNGAATSPSPSNPTAPAQPSATGTKP
jgi:flagellar basal body-associated protein FliL